MFLCGHTHTTADHTALFTGWALFGALVCGAAGIGGAALGALIAASAAGAGFLAGALSGVGVALLSGLALDIGAFILSTACAVSAADIGLLAVAVFATFVAGAAFHAAFLIARTGNAEAGATARYGHTDAVTAESEAAIAACAACAGGGAIFGAEFIFL